MVNKNLELWVESEVAEVFSNFTVAFLILLAPALLILTLPILTNNEHENPQLRLLPLISSLLPRRFLF